MITYVFSLFRSAAVSCGKLRSRFGDPAPVRPESGTYLCVTRGRVCAFFAVADVNSACGALTMGGIYMLEGRCFILNVSAHNLSRGFSCYDVSLKPAF